MRNIVQTPRIRAAAVFLAIFAASTTASALVGSNAPGERLKLALAFRKARRSASKNIRFALLPAILPLVYRDATAALNLCIPGALEKVDLAGTTKRSILQAAPVLASSPLFLLLPKKLRVQLAAYLLLSFLYSLARLRPSRARDSPPTTVAQERKNRRLLPPNWRDYLPPVWTLIVTGNTWLLWAFLHENHSFPKGYQSIIVDHSRHYLPPGQSLSKILSTLRTTSHPRNPPHSRHTYATCSLLHPGERSCSKTALLGFIEEARRTVPLIGGVTALGLFLKARDPKQRRVTSLLLDWLNGTARGTTYISGSITTAWAITCILQRILPEGRLTRARWLLNGSASNVWLFLLPAKRRVAISLYIARMALLSMWKVWKDRGGFSIRYGEVALIALAWIGLRDVREHGGDEAIGGLLAKVLRYIEGDTTPPAPDESGNNDGP